MRLSEHWIWPTGPFSSLTGLMEGRRLVRWWKNTFELRCSPGELSSWAAAAPEPPTPPPDPALAAASLPPTFLTGWGFLKSCLGIWPKLLMKPMVAFLCRGSSMLKMSTFPS